VASPPRDIAAWVATHVFGRPPEFWAAIFESDAGLERWCRQGATVPARWLAAVIDDARACGQPLFPQLRIETVSAQREEFCDWLVAGNGPWPAEPRETGCWIGSGRARHAFDRMAARLHEIAAAVLGTAAPPRAIAWSPRPGRALTVVETARGFLLHAGRLDSGRTTLAGYGVQAPTDWNFASTGPVATLLGAAAQATEPARRERLARLIATAYAPCLAFEVEHAGA